MDQSCRRFTAALAAPAPVPGGGAAAALVGGMGAALCAMVASLTLGRKQGQAQEQMLRELLEAGEQVRQRLMDVAEEDARAFAPLARTYAIPKSDPARADQLERATLAACQAPLEMMERTGRAVELLEELLPHSSILLGSDVGCGALCCRAALESASLALFVNTRALVDRVQAGRLDRRAESLLACYLPRAEQVAQTVVSRLRHREDGPC